MWGGAYFIGVRNNRPMIVGSIEHETDFRKYLNQVALNIQPL